MPQRKFKLNYYKELRANGKNYCSKCENIKKQLNDYKDNNF